MFFKILVAYFVLWSIFPTADAQITDLNTPINITKVIDNKYAETGDNIQRKGRDNLPENKQGIDAKSININLFPIPQMKTQIPKSKSMQTPFNFLIDTKPRNMPTKIPLILKTANIIPGPGHYVRLKADPNRKKCASPKVDINSGLKPEKPRPKVIPKDKFIIRPTIAFKAKDEKQSRQRNKSKVVNFFEDDTNYDSLPPAPKEPVSRKSKRPEKIESSKNDKESKDDVVQIKNATHLIRISKLPQPHEVRQKVANQLLQAKSAKDEICPENVSSKPLDEFDVPVTPNNEEVSVTMIIKSDGTDSSDIQSSSKLGVLEARQPPIITQSTDDSNSIITITNRNYEELEERPGGYSEANRYIDDDPLLAPPEWNNVPANPYNNYQQNSQLSYDQYLKCLAENDPSVYRKSNCYPHVVDIPDSPDYPQAYTSENEMVQDVYGFRPDIPSNVVNIRPENNLGRIWRTWKDTQIRISKPNIFNNKPDYGRNFNDYNYGDMISKPARTMYGNPAIGFNGYYDNINSPIPYPYSYQTYRYMM